MCGLYFSSNINNIDIKALESAMTVRGGDDFKFHSIVMDGKMLNFAHSRLAINSIGSPLQPHIDNGVVILFNGEIYNYSTIFPNEDELSEVEVIKKIYYTSGVQGLRVLDGMFAIVIIDLREKKMICLRDFVGQKPLWINFRDQSFEIASDPSYFQNTNVAGEHFYNVVSKINLGMGIGLSWLTGLEEVKCNSIEIFDLLSFVKIEKHLIYDNEIVNPNTLISPENSDHIITEAIKKVVPSQDFGLFLSGGLDSRAVLTGLVRIRAAPKCCFTIKGSESDAAESIARYYNIPIKVVDIDSVENKKIMENYLCSSGLTSVDPASIGMVALSHACRSHGLKVALCGDGGDEALLGYDFFFSNEARCLRFKEKLMRFLVNIVAFFMLNRNDIELIVSSVVGRHLIRRERIPGMFRLSLSLLSGAQLKDFYDFISSFDSIQDFYYGIVLPHSLCRKTDTAAHHAKIEVRSPLLQKEFLMFGQSLAANNMIKDNSKIMLVDYCKETLRIAPIGKKVGLNVELEKSIVSLKNALSRKRISYSNHRSILNSSMIVKPLVQILSQLNRKAKYAELKVKASRFSV